MGKIRQQLKEARRKMAEQHRAELTQVRQNLKDIHEYHQALAQDWVEMIAGHGNQSGRLPEALHKAVCKGLDQVEAKALSIPPVSGDPKNQKLLEESKDVVLDHLILLMRQGPGMFVDGYRQLISEKNSRTSQLAADGVRVMAHELGIETSLTAEFQKRRQSEIETSGSKERSL